MRQQASNLAPRLSRRTKIVWGALLGAMTLVGGSLSAITGHGVGALQGVTLSPLTSLSGPSTIESVFRTNAPLDQERWASIVIHHSGSPAGSPASLDEQHRSMGLAGLGYHFVIGNGVGMSDGEIHVGRRWLEQLPGAHVAGVQGDHYNRTSVGVCLVGNGDRRRFTDAQIQGLAELTAALARELDIPADRILLHSDLASTRSPGAFFPEARFREMVVLAP